MGDVIFFGNKLYIIRREEYDKIDDPFNVYLTISEVRIQHALDECPDGDFESSNTGKEILRLCAINFDVSDEDEGIDNAIEFMGNYEEVLNLYHGTHKF